MWQAVREMGSIGTRPTEWDDRPGPGKGGRVRCAGGPHDSESGKTDETQCEWGLRSPPVFHWLERALRVPGWTKRGLLECNLCATETNSSQRTVPVLGRRSSLARQVHRGRRQRWVVEGRCMKGRPERTLPQKQGLGQAPTRYAAQKGSGTPTANARKLSLLKWKVNSRPWGDLPLRLGAKEAPDSGSRGGVNAPRLPTQAPEMPREASGAESPSHSEHGLNAGDNKTEITGRQRSTIAARTPFLSEPAVMKRP